MLLITISQMQYIFNDSRSRSILHYLVILLVGIIIGKYDILEKVNGLKMRWYLDIIVTVILLFMAQILIIDEYKYLFNCITAICLAYLVLKFYGNRKSVIFSFLGKHSMNCFLIHTFVFKYYCHEFVYGFKNFILIYVVLALISLGIAVIIEGAKKIIRYDDLRDKLLLFIKDNTI